MSGFVYFIGNNEGEECRVKIGFTKGNPYARMASLQTGSPVGLDLLVWAYGSIEDEQALHRRFDAYRERGEWFTLEGSLQGYVCDLISNTPPQTPASTVWTDYLAAEAVR